MSALKQPLETFSFLVGVSGIDPGNAEYLDALYEAGCGDALVSLINGEIRIEFDREAYSYEEATASAERDIEKAGGKAEFFERLDD